LTYLDTLFEVGETVAYGRLGQLHNVQDAHEHEYPRQWSGPHTCSTDAKLDYDSDETKTPGYDIDTQRLNSYESIPSSCW